MNLNSRLSVSIAMALANSYLDEVETLDGFRKPKYPTWTPFPILCLEKRPEPPELEIRFDIPQDRYLKDDVVIENVSPRVYGESLGKRKRHNRKHY